MGNADALLLASLSLHRHNARGYPPSDVPADLALYGYEFACADIAAIMRGLSIPRAHVVGLLGMGGYAALQFGLRHPDMATAIVAAGAGTGSAPSVREAWLRDAPAMAKSLPRTRHARHGGEMANGPTRIQLKRKGPARLARDALGLREHSPQGMSNTMARYQAQRPSLHDFQKDFALMRADIARRRDEDLPCLETNLMLKAAIPSAGLWVCPNTGHAINLEEPAAFNAAVQVSSPPPNAEHGQRAPDLPGGVAFAQRRHQPVEREAERR